MAKKKPPRGSGFRVQQKPRGPFVWLPREMLEHPSFRALGINARQVLDLLLIENSLHAGQENGRLQVPYTQAVSYGISREGMAAGIRDLEAMGIIRCKHGLRIAVQKTPNLYGLTWLDAFDQAKPTNNWLRVTPERIEEYYASRRRRVRPSKKPATI